MAKIREIPVLIDQFPLSYRLEQECCQYCEDEVDKHEKGENVEKGWQGELDRLDQSLETFVLVEESEQA